MNENIDTAAPIEVRVVNLDIEFLTMVMLFVKAAIAIVPAVMIAAFFWVVFAGIFSGIFQ